MVRAWLAVWSVWVWLMSKHDIESGLMMMTGWSADGTKGAITNPC